jgi:D-psicose/D-tagatose/L-ribulose 3-epimerase
MPKFGAHAFVWIPEWTTEAGNHAIAEAGKVGFDFLEIPLLKPAEFDVAVHKKAIADVGIGVVASLVLPRDSHMPDKPEKAKNFLILALDKLEAVGGTYLCGCIGYAHGLLTGKPPSDAERQVVVETLAEVADDAQKRGMTLALEVCNRYETYLYNVLEDAQATVKAIRDMGYPNIEVHGDTYHMNIEEEGFYKPIVACAETLGYMHMSESHRGLVGTGTVNWDEIFQGLVDAHYTGPLALESFAAINPDLIAATCLWRPPNRPSAVLASEGLRFLREKAEQYGLN